MYKTENQIKKKEKITSATTITTKISKWSKYENKNMHRKWERKRDEKKIREWVNRVEFIRRVCGEMNEYETVWALVNVPVQSSLVFLRHYKLHLSLTHSLVNARSLLLLSLSLSLPLSLSRPLLFFFILRTDSNAQRECICLSSGCIIFMMRIRLRYSHFVLIYLQL